MANLSLLTMNKHTLKKFWIFTKGYLQRTHRSARTSEVTESKMETYVNECDSIGVILTHTRLIVEKILNYLDNRELFNCKLVCSFWNDIAGNILSKRIIIINRNIPYEVKKEAFFKGDFLQVDFLKHQKFQYIVESSLTNYEELAHPRKYSEIKHEFGTQIAIFPSLQGLKVQRFAFHTESKFYWEDGRTVQLKQLINLPKNGLKFILLFVPIFACIFSDLDVPALIISPPQAPFCTGLTNFSGFAFSGERMNVVMFKIKTLGVFPYERVESSIMEEIRKIKDYKLLPFKCVALMFIKDMCPEDIQRLTLCLFKETFPNLPLLIFNYLSFVTNEVFNDLSKNADEILTNIFDITGTDIDRIMIRIVLIWLN